MKKTQLKLTRTTIQQMSTADLTNVNGGSGVCPTAGTCPVTGLFCPVTVGPKYTTVCPPPGTTTAQP